MPFAVKRRGTRYQVVNTETGEVKAESTSKAKAERQLRLLKGIEKNWTPTGDGCYTRKVNGKTVRLQLTGEKHGKTDG